MEVCTSNMMGDESTNMGDSASKRYRQHSEIKVMNDYYLYKILDFWCKFFNFFDIMILSLKSASNFIFSCLIIAETLVNFCTSIY